MLQRAPAPPTADRTVDAEPDDPLVGTVLLSKLRVLRRIGAGGAGVVYEVEHLITKHRRALKTLKASSRDSPVQISRFLREAGIAGRLKSARIVETFDAGRLPDGTPYVLMELLDGRSLGAVLRDDGPLSAERVIRFAIEVCDALEAAHAAGVVHRDIKPENIFLLAASDGETEHVKVLDFGVCKTLDPTFDEIATLTGEGTSVGTPYFMAPEQIDGSSDIDARADVYALGVTMYQLASGELPFHAGSAAALAVKIERGAHRPLDAIREGIPSALARVVERAMARQPDDRFPSVGALRDALRAVDASSGIGSDVATGVARAVPAATASPDADPGLAETSTALVREADKSRRRRRSIFAVGAAIAISSGLAVTAWLAPWSKEGPAGASTAGASTAREADTFADARDTSAAASLSNATPGDPEIDAASVASKTDGWLPSASIASAPSATPAQVTLGPRDAKATAPGTPPRPSAAAPSAAAASASATSTPASPTTAVAAPTSTDPFARVPGTKPPIN